MKGKKMSLILDVSKASVYFDDIFT